MRFIAAQGALVRDPATMRVIPEEGIELHVDPHHAPTDLHWSRLHRDGDIVPVSSSKKVR